MDKDQILSAQDTGRTPSGSVLIKKPDLTGNNAWRRITIEHVRSGQTRPYGPSIWEALILIEGGHPSTKPGFHIPFGTGIDEKKVKQIAKALVHEFEDEPKYALDTRLESIACEDRGETYSLWRVRIYQEYAD